jgi:hypothetical protein
MNNEQYIRLVLSLFSARDWLAVRTHQPKALIASCKLISAMLVRHRIPSLSLLWFMPPPLPRTKMSTTPNSVA